MTRLALTLVALCYLSGCASDSPPRQPVNNPKCEELCGIMSGCGAEPGQCARQCAEKYAHSTCSAAVNDEYLQCAVTNIECSAINDCFVDNKLGYKMFDCRK